MSDRQYGSETINSQGDITGLQGCRLMVSHLPDQAGNYWQAWVNGVQDDGLSRNEDIRNAYRRSQQQCEISNFIPISDSLKTKLRSTGFLTKCGAHDLPLGKEKEK